MPPGPPSAARRGEGTAAGRARQGRCPRHEAAGSGLSPARVRAARLAAQRDRPGGRLPLTPEATGAATPAPEAAPEATPGAALHAVPEVTRERPRKRPSDAAGKQSGPATPERVREHYAEDLAAGQVPSIRQIRREWPVGYDRARELYAALAAGEA